jgi:hypothetical protein
MLLDGGVYFSRNVKTLHGEAILADYDLWGIRNLPVAQTRTHWRMLMVY